MREIIARAVCLFTLVVAVTLSLVFASAHNPRSGPPVGSITVPVPGTNPAGHPDRRLAERIEPRPAAGQAAAGSIARGREVYAQQNCSTCHAIGGEGNPRHPLDAVGARYDAAELRAWITGTGAAGEVLPPAIVKRKQRYQDLPASDLAALIAYLSTLKSAR